MHYLPKIITSRANGEDILLTELISEYLTRSEISWRDYHDREIHIVLYHLFRDERYIPAYDQVGDEIRLLDYPSIVASIEDIIEHIVISDDSPCREDIPKNQLLDAIVESSAQSISVRSQINTILTLSGDITPCESIMIRSDTNHTGTHHPASRQNLVTMTQERITELIKNESIPPEDILLITLTRLLTDTTDPKHTPLTTYESSKEIWADALEARDKIDKIIRSTRHSDWSSDL